MAGLTERKKRGAKKKNQGVFCFMWTAAYSFSRGCINARARYFSPVVLHIFCQMYVYTRLCCFDFPQMKISGSEGGHCINPLGSTGAHQTHSWQSYK